MPQPSAVTGVIRARQTCLLLWAVAIRHNRGQSLAVRGIHFDTDPLARMLASSHRSRSNSLAIKRGLIVEADAADWYEFDHDVTVQNLGFVTDGCSPDRLVDADGLLEIKAPLPHTQVEYWISGEFGERFRQQLQGQFYISQRRIKALEHELQMF